MPETTLSTRDILKKLPHRFPFLLVDRVISKQVTTGSDRTGQKVVALKNVTFNEPYFLGHFPDLPVMPGVLQIEAMAQAACLAFLRDDDQEFDFFLVSMSEAKFRRMVVPGDTLLIEAEVSRDRKSMIQVRCKTRVHDQVVSEVEILAKVNVRSERDKLG